MYTMITPTSFLEGQRTREKPKDSSGYNCDCDCSNYCKSKFCIVKNPNCIQIQGPSVTTFCNKNNCDCCSCKDNNNKYNNNNSGPIVETIITKQSAFFAHGNRHSLRNRKKLTSKKCNLYSHNNSCDPSFKSEKSDCYIYNNNNNNNSHKSKKSSIKLSTVNFLVYFVFSLTLLALLTNCEEAFQSQPKNFVNLSNNNNYSKITSIPHRNISLPREITAKINASTSIQKSLIDKGKRLELLEITDNSDNYTLTDKRVNFVESKADNNNNYYYFYRLPGAFDSKAKAVGAGTIKVDSKTSIIIANFGAKTEKVINNNSELNRKLNLTDFSSFNNLLRIALNFNFNPTASLLLAKTVNFFYEKMSDSNGNSIAELVSVRDEFLNDVFPQDFVWGVASSSYQIEGGWNEDGKGEHIWDRFCHSDPNRIKDKSNADVTCDSYHKYGEDVKIVKELGAKSYRLSISWARILPKGTMETVNQAGIDYYNKIIDALIAEGIEPMLTLYHWDLPQNLQDMGGWENEGIIGIFGDYARICYQSFGDRVKLWVTINEPYIFCMAGYDWGVFAPGIRQPSVSPYQCVHTVIKAHAMAYSIYKEQFSATQKGKIGIAVDSWWYEPADPSNQEDKDASERALQFRLGWILGPIFTGEYPPVMRQLIDGHSKLENRSESRLPFFSKEWTSKIKGSVDFVGLNHYTTELVKPATADPTHPSWNSDTETLRYFDPSWPSTGSSWLKLVPWGLRKLLNWIKNEYGNPVLMITENGCSDLGGEKPLEDKQRSEYFTLYINEVLKAVKIDGCNVTGYYAWSLLDVFEWDVGYTEKFGIYSVNFSDPNRTRTAKNSAKTLSKIFVDNGFPKKLTGSALSSSGSTTQNSLYCSTAVLTLALVFALISVL